MYRLMACDKKVASSIPIYQRNYCGDIEMGNQFQNSVMLLTYNGDTKNNDDMVKKESRKNLMKE